jgi:hypothetical protein
MARMIEDAADAPGGMTMLLMTALFLLALVVVRWAPDTPLAKILRAWLIEAPVGALNDLSPAKVMIGAIVLVCLVGMALSAPEVVAMIGVADLSAYLDAAVIAMLIGAAARVKFVLGSTLRVSRNIFGRSNRSRAYERQPRRQKSKSPRSSDEVDPHGDWAFA